MSGYIMDWLAYSEQAQENFIERFAHLDLEKHQDKAPEIAKARRLLEDRLRKQKAQDAIGAAEDAIVSLTGNALRPIFEPAYRAAIDQIKVEFDIK